MVGRLAGGSDSVELEKAFGQMTFEEGSEGLLGLLWAEERAGRVCLLYICIFLQHLARFLVLTQLAGRRY